MKKLFGFLFSVVLVALLVARCGDENSGTSSMPTNLSTSITSAGN